MTAIIIFKWLFIFSTIALGVYHYVQERRKLNTLSTYISEPKVLSELKDSARVRMGHFFFLFGAFVVWIMSYDLEIENVNKEKAELAAELQRTSETYANLNDSQKRLTEAKVADQNLIDDVFQYYTDVFVNYYVMRKCDKIGSDDIFIVNSAMLREMSLNNVPLSLKEDIIRNAKTVYFEKFSDISCEQLNTTHAEIANNYKSYITAVREVLKATF